MERPANLKYATTHEWARVENDKIITVGITDFAVKALRDLVYVELPDVEDIVEKGNSFGEVESVKAVSDLYSPVDGEVIEINDVLTENIETLGNDPFGAGWLVKIKMDDPSQLDTMLSAKEYEKEISKAKH